MVSQNGTRAEAQAPASTEPGAGEPAPRRRRADARRNVDALVEAARTVFATSGVDAPAKEITDLAGLGVGTLYRHFPQRSDLVTAVVRSGIDAVADAGPTLSAAHEPAEALTRWIHQFTDLLAAKRGLASALHSGDPAFSGLPGYFLERLGPTLAALLDAAVADGTVRDDVSAEQLLHAITQLSQPIPGHRPEYNQRVVSVFVDGLRRPASAPDRGHRQSSAATRRSEGES
ncbi:TetR/AcrR family transcriptional regulator [Streptomyces sp. NPDC127098]|uniref:TetR/AcrR family transcriptional regulator n=1 Tax=Streptomyces sp. NPDC127098 TaxID=3347137 RepID=UPI003661227D